MSVDFYVAIHAADWPTPAALNRCLGELKYPLRLIETSRAALDEPMREVPGSAGLVVMFENKRVELEASLTRLGPDSPYALALRPSETGTLPDGPNRAIQMFLLPGETGSAATFVPRDLNTDLQAMGVPGPDYKDGDYVITFSFRSDVSQYRAGWYLIACLIKCARGFAFEDQQGSFGTDDFADSLLEKAADPNSWR